MSHNSDAEAALGLFFVFVLPVLALAIAIYSTRGRTALSAARVSSGIAGGLSVMSAIVLERLLNGGPPSTATLTMLGIGAVPLIPRSLLARDKPGQVEMLLAELAAAAIAVTATLAGLFLGFVGAIAEPGHPGGLQSFFVLLPVGCCVALQVKTIAALRRARHEPRSAAGLRDR